MSGYANRPRVIDTRSAQLAMAHEFLNNKSHCYYSEGPNRWAWRSHPTPTWPFYSDCSGTVTAIAFYAHGNDPNGLDYTGGNTASIRKHAENKNLIIVKSKLLTCDLIMFGLESDGYTPKHVVMALQPGTVSDPICFSMGKQGDPSLVPFSVLRGLGAPIFVRNVTRVG